MVTTRYAKKSNNNNCFRENNLKLLCHASLNSEKLMQSVDARMQQTNAIHNNKLQ